MNAETSGPRAFTVSEITSRIKNRLEGEYPQLWVEGQVTNFRGPAASGHRYFGLKDESAQIKAVMFKGPARGLAFELEDGQQVLAFGRLSVYEPRGEYQLVCESLEARGLGALQAQFEKLKKKLQAEGLFDESRKRPLPRFPRRVAVITSPTGAVIQDILNVTGRRCPWVHLAILPVKVQGAGAKEEIAAALRFASRELRDSADLALLARGGGSLEDLWAFNEETVARAIAGCALPVLSAVGHEVDYTIADFVADRRAPTPSAAAEILSPSGDEVRQWAAALSGRLRQAFSAGLEARKARLHELRGRLGRAHPRAMLERHSQRLDEVRQRLALAARRWLESRRGSLAALAGRLQALSPLGILARGYAACFDAGGRLLRSAGQARAGEAIEVRLGKGRLDATVRASHAA